jgi:hypothetical protein
LGNKNKEKMLLINPISSIRVILNPVDFHKIRPIITKGVRNEHHIETCIKWLRILIMASLVAALFIPSLVVFADDGGPTVESVNGAVQGYRWI